MKHLERRQTLPVIVLLIILAFSGWSCTRPAVPRVRFGLVVHGGAGTILKENMTPAQEEAYRSKLTEALMAGYEVLNDEGPALEAVVAAIVIMEDSPLFNAGKGAVFNSDGKNELDASIMDGDALRAGAVAGVRHVKNPIRLARLVMEASPHVMMASEGAERFAQEQGVELMTDDYFFTQHRWEALQRAKEREQEASRMNPAGKGHGTVGAVALDRAGNLAAGTSTGGMTNKKFGRVGDSPIIGAGTYADNRTCAVSCTG
ncbi:MAG: isoaspartyl peptidase/L-asparaginase family protein, partial [Candidatus Neomarinimicrobiota bacterium]